MGLLDDDNVPPFIRRGAKGIHDSNTEDDERNFSSLQNLGHKKQSLTFEDSPFADRQPKQDHECDADMLGYCYQCRRKML